MGSTLLAGREIDIYHYPTDSSAVMLNETALKRMRLTNPLGSRIRFDGRNWQVVGIVKDFIFASPYERINPVVITGPASGLPLYWLSIRLNPARDVAQNLHIAESLFKQYNPGYPFDYSFAEQSYKAKFSDQQRTRSLTGLFTGLTLLISALGLFGLAAYSAEQRTKEIGIRKVLGASVTSLAGLLTKEFLYLLALAFAIGAPIGWYAVETWLEHFPYRITLGAGAFIFPLVTAIGIVLLAVGVQAIQAALKNPVKTLRTE
jgi:ABC-type antimicrobial peptide transport system permease subunit